VGASVVVVESPLQSDLSDVNTSSSSSSTSTDTNISSNGNPSSTSNSISGTSAASIHSPSASTSNTSGNNDNNAYTDANGDGDSNVPSLVNSSSSSPGGTIGGDSSKTSTTDSTPVGGMQESTYVLSDSAYVPAKPAAAASATGDVTTSNAILPSFSEDSADYSHSTSNNSSNTNNNNNQANNNQADNNNDSPSSVSPLARSVVVRVECAVWSKYSYTTESTEPTCNGNNTFTTTSKAVPLQDYHYSMANQDSNNTRDDKDAEKEGDLQTELVTCIKVYLFFLLQHTVYFCLAALQISQTTCATSGLYIADA